MTLSQAPCESTQKMLSHDTHIAYYQKRQLAMMSSHTLPSHAPCESIQKMLSHDTQITHY
jgi:hypothetical protein